MLDGSRQTASIVVGSRSVRGRAIVERHHHVGDKRSHREIVFWTGLPLNVAPSDQVSVVLTEPASEVVATVVSVDIRADESGTESEVRLIVTEAEGRK
jgi:hypothetical protein